MLDNPILQTLRGHRSIRRYKPEAPSEETVATIVRAGQQAPFAGQFGSVLLSRKCEKNPFSAPLLFTVCADLHRIERIMKKRDWLWVMNDMFSLLFAVQDATYMAENMVIAAESLGLGSCFLGDTPYQAERIARDYKLPDRVFPLVQLAMGYPDEDPPVRPRYPLSFTLFEDEYPSFSDEDVQAAMEAMDDGYLAQEYYVRANYKIPLEHGRKETFTFADYGWTEHMCRKWGQWFPESTALMEQFEKRGFHLTLPQTDD